MHPVIRMHGCEYDCSAAHGAQWQELELIGLLQHGNMCKRREKIVYALLIPMEMFMHACLRPTEAARFREQKCAKNHQLMLPTFKGFYDRHVQLTSMSYIHAKCRVRYVYIRKH